MIIYSPLVLGPSTGGKVAVVAICVELDWIPTAQVYEGRVEEQRGAKWRDHAECLFSNDGWMDDGAYMT